MRFMLDKDRKRLHFEASEFELVQFIKDELVPVLDNHYACKHRFERNPDNSFHITDETGRVSSCIFYLSTPNLFFACLYGENRDIISIRKLIVGNHDSLRKVERMTELSESISEYFELSDED